MGASDSSGGRSVTFKGKGSSPTPGTSSSATRPSSSSGWLGGGGRSFTLAGFRRSSGSKVKEVIVPVLATPAEGKEDNVSNPNTPPVSTFVTVPTSNTSRPAVDLSLSQTLTFDTPSSPRHTRRKSSSFAFKRTETISDYSTAGNGSPVNRKARPSSSSGWLGDSARSLAGFKRTGTISDHSTAGNSSPVNHNARPSSSSGWLGDSARSLAGFTRSKVKEVIVPTLTTPTEGKEENDSDLHTPPVSTSVTVPASNTSRPAVDLSLSQTLTFDTPSSPRTRRKSSFSFKRTETISDYSTAGNGSPVNHNARPSSSSGWLGDSARSLAGFTRSKVKEVIVPTLTTPTEGKEENESDLHTPPVSTFVTVPASNTSRPSIDRKSTL